MRIFHCPLYQLIHKRQESTFNRHVISFHWTCSDEVKSERETILTVRYWSFRSVCAFSVILVFRSCHCTYFFGSFRSVLSNLGVVTLHVIAWISKGSPERSNYLLKKRIKTLFQLPYFPDYKSPRSINRTSQNMHDKEEKKTYISRSGV